MTTLQDCCDHGIQIFNTSFFRFLYFELCNYFGLIPTVMYPPRMCVVNSIDAIECLECTIELYLSKTQGAPKIPFCFFK